ncbi:MAG: HAD family hydrolase, partial [Treponema sp.]|nr:HAD family hydrolase [Treponema sp.]
QSGYIELTLEKTGLTPYVCDFECYGRTGRGKAENLMMLVSRNQITSPLYIGDTQTDCDACKQAGIPFVWASYGFGKADSYLAKLERFSDLTQILSH